MTDGDKGRRYVRLNSGGPLMTVRSVRPSADRPGMVAEVDWFDGFKRQQGEFPVTSNALVVNLFVGNRGGTIGHKWPSTGPGCI